MTFQRNLYPPIKTSQIRISDQNNPGCPGKLRFEHASNATLSNSCGCVAEPATYGLEFDTKGYSTI